MFFFYDSVEPKKARIDILRTSVQFSARELPSETISCIFGWCLYQNNPGLSWSLSFVWHFASLVKKWSQNGEVAPKAKGMFGIVWASLRLPFWIVSKLFQTEANSKCPAVLKHFVCGSWTSIICVYVKYGLCTFCSLQLKRGLFWYGHHPKMHEMVSDRSSRAESWTDLR